MIKDMNDMSTALFLVTPYICLFLLCVFATFWPCFAKRGRSIAFIHTV